MMNRVHSQSARDILLSAVILSCLWLPMTSSGASECDRVGDYAFVCGPKNAEDLVLVPGTQWIIASSMAPEGGLYLVDTRLKTWEKLFPGETPSVQQDTENYGACPGAPAPEAMVTHGLNLRPATERNSTLYVVGHGGREAIEVFDADATGEKPRLTWRGCILTPDGMAANSVASSPDGSLLVTIPLHTGIPIDDALAGKPSGGVYAWSPGDTNFTLVDGTGMPYANGIEVSADGEESYVASSGLFTVTAFSNTNPARVLRRTDALRFIPDNVHMDAQGRLLTAGLHIDDPVCGNLKQSDEFDFEAFMTCPRAFTVWAIDPESMQGRALATAPAIEKFSNITMALPVGEELWIGTFSGDRIAYRAMKEERQ